MFTCNFKACGHFLAFVFVPMSSKKPADMCKYQAFLVVCLYSTNLVSGAFRTSLANLSERLLFSVDNKGSDYEEADITIVTILDENQFEEYHIPKRVVIVRLDVPKPQPSVQLQWCGH